MTAMHDVGAPPERAPANAGAERATAAALGERLRLARERTGLARDEFARRAHIPSGVLADLEEGRFERLGAGVFVRGYLRSFARAAGLPESELLALVPAQDELPPPLVAQRVAPATPRWVTRYATPVAYALLTAVVMVPLVYLARPGAQQLAQAPSLTPIDSAQPPAAVATGSTLPPASPSAPAPGAGAAQVLAGAEAFVGPPAPEAQPLPRAPAASPAPVMASLAPLPQVAAPLGARRVTLRLAGDSWVEFTADDGGRLEYALLPAGTVRDYDLQGSAVLMIGNASAARLTVDGRVVDLGPLSSENDVARVRLGDDPPSDLD